jgi:hypothetical protein
MIGLGTLRRVAGEVRRDLAAARDRDPAATGVSPAEILAAWPGVHALPRTASLTRCAAPACRSPRARSPTRPAR